MGDGNTDDAGGPVDRVGVAASTEEEPDYRFTLANERTFLAWIRTALALIAGGVAVVQLVPEFAFPGARHGLGVLLTALGGVLAVLSVRRWQRVQTAMRQNKALPRTRVPLALAVALVAVTVFVLVLLILSTRRP